MEHFWICLVIIFSIKAQKRTKAKMKIFSNSMFTLLEIVDL